MELLTNDGMTTYISIATLTVTGSTNYELWKLKTKAWTVVMYLSREKQLYAGGGSVIESSRK